MQPKEKREEKGMSRADLARSSTVSYHQLYMYELGLSKPSDKTLTKIAKALNCEIEELRD